MRRMEGYLCQQGSQHLAPELLLRALRIIKRKAACKQAAFSTQRFPVRTGNGAQGDAQIVPGTIIEVNLVAYVQSQSDRA